MPGYVATVLDDDGDAGRRQASSGRLAVKGPTGCRYLADAAPDACTCRTAGTSPATRSCQDADGYFWYQARNDDMIISSGYNIAGPEIEEALITHPDVVECAVVGLPDADRGQVVAAYVVLRPGVDGDDAKRKELQDFVKQQIAPYKYPRVLEFVDALPRTSTGKVQRFRLREPG